MAIFNSYVELPDGIKFTLPKWLGWKFQPVAFFALFMSAALSKLT